MVPLSAQGCMVPPARAQRPSPSLLLLLRAAALLLPAGAAALLHELRTCCCLRQSGAPTLPLFPYHPLLLGSIVFAVVVAPLRGASNRDL
jgi:hypothetical protein